MTVTIHQPHYLPWLGWVAKVASADQFIALDDVQFEKNGWQNRTRCSTGNGLQFLTLPVRHAGIVSRQISIRDIELADPQITARHFETLRHRYRRSPGWTLLADRLATVLQRDYRTLGEANLATMQLTLDVFEVRTPMLPSSSFNTAGRKTERLVELVRATGGNAYLSGVGGQAYLETGQFERAEIEVRYQKFSHPTWKQRTGKEFVPGAFALEWFLEEPETAVQQFHAAFGRMSEQG